MLKKPLCRLQTKALHRVAYFRFERSISDSIITYARELRATVTAFRDSAALLDVQQSEFATRSLDNSGSVGTSVVAEISMSVAGSREWQNLFD